MLNVQTFTRVFYIFYLFRFSAYNIRLQSYQSQCHGETLGLQWPSLFTKALLVYSQIKPFSGVTAALQIILPEFDLHYQDSAHCEAYVISPIIFLVGERTYLLLTYEP